MSAILIDTNILIYAYEIHDTVKKKHAIHLVNHLGQTGAGCLSVQCLSEFFSVATRGRKPLLSIAHAAQQVDLLIHAFTVYDITPLIVLESTRGVARYQFAYWDALLWATARLNQIPIIFSEDFNSGSRIEGVLFVNPFTNDFVMAEWA